MNEKIVLADESLHYIWLGTGKLHAMDIRWPQITMCGRHIPHDSVPHVSRRLSPEQLCGSCYLICKRSYSGKVRIESEATAP